MVRRGLQDGQFVHGVQRRVFLPGTPGGLVAVLKVETCLRDTQFEYVVTVAVKDKIWETKLATDLPEHI